MPFKFYAVARGYVPGIYRSWPECNAQVHGFVNNRYKGFDTIEEAKYFIEQHGGLPTSPPRGSKFKRKASALEETGEIVVGRIVPDPKRARATKDALKLARDKFDKAPLYVFTDGNAKGNGRAGAVAGSAVYCGNPDVSDFRGRPPGQQTNNRAELFAFAMALVKTMDKPRVLIRPDSEYVTLGVTEKSRLATWVANGWKLNSGGNAKNTDLWQVVWDLLRERERRGLQAPEVVHVPAHSGVRGNEIADNMADEATRLYMPTAESLAGVFPFPVKLRLADAKDAPLVEIAGPPPLSDPEK